jgi:hypothetical protein
MSLPKNPFLLSAPPPPNPDWLEVFLDLDWSSSASLQVDRWLDYVTRKFEVGRIKK